VLPRQRGPGLAGLAAFTLDTRGRVASWPEAAARLFGRPAQAVTGQDVHEVLMTGPGQRELAGEALAEVAAGRAWTGTPAMPLAGGTGPVDVRVRCSSSALMNNAGQVDGRQPGAF
jgi:PAS domain-containing protein